jgi:hypothetical protein
MATNGNGSAMAKQDLRDCIDEATDILEAAYIPEADRKTLATAVGDALAAVSGDTGDDDSDVDDGSDDGTTSPDG